jgi:glycosyltransferase involved in cell wall biosynthesis
MTDCARKSLLMRNAPMTHIFNCVDTRIFHPMDRANARRALGLPEDRRIVCFGADAVRSSRKGFDLLEHALAPLGVADVTLAVFGAREEGDVAGIPTRWLGFVNGEEALARVYAAADVLVVPSRIDNLPNTAVEALSCGTPVVAFRIGGLSELVDHGRDGYLATPFDVADLARGIRWVLRGGALVGDGDDGGEVARDTERHRARLSAHARERAVKAFSPDVVAAQYGEWYRRAMSA